MSIAYRALRHHVIVDVQSIYWPPGSIANDPPSGAFECVLYFCVKMFAASTSNGHYTEQVLSTWPPANMSMPDQPEIDLNNDYTSYNFSLYEVEQKKNFTLAPPDDPQTYAVDRLTFDLLGRWTGSTVFAGSIAAETTFVKTAMTYDINDVAERMYNELTATLGRNQTIEGYQHTNKSYNSTIPHEYSVVTTEGPGRAMAQIATSLTSYMRQSDQDSHKIVGEATYVETFVQARWYWLVCPVILLFTTLMFTLSTICLSAQRGIPAWKSSSIAVLVHGLDELGSRALSDDRLDKMETRAGEHEMAVRRLRGLWTLQTE